MSNAGTDYGMGIYNIDRKNGIRYGVIPQNYVLQAWVDCSSPIYSDLECETCEFTEPEGYSFEDSGYKAFCDEHGDIFIEKSPYFTYANFCSPCAPGAGHLLHPNPEGIKTYCFDKDWFDDEKDIPYSIYEVKTGNLIWEVK